MKKFKNTMLSVMAMMSSNEGAIFISAFAYSLVVGIAPIIILAVTFVGTYLYGVNDLILVLTKFVPEDLLMPFVSYLSASNVDNPILLISLFGVSVWMASKTVYLFVLLSSESDDIEVRPVYLRVLSLAYFIIIAAMIVAVIAVVTALPIPGKIVALPVLILFLILFYRVVGFQYTSFKDVLPGAVVASVLLALLGNLFFVYVQNYSNYQSVYGPLSSLMILMISSWFVAWLFYLGHVINFVLRNKNKEARKKERLIRFLDNRL